MKRIIICLCALIFLLTGCDALSANKYTTAEMKAVEPVGTVPKAFQAIVNENLFHNIRVFENRLMKFQQNNMLRFTLTLLFHQSYMTCTADRL